MLVSHDLSNETTDAFGELAEVARAYTAAHELGDRDAVLLRAGALHRQAASVAALIERQARRNAEQARGRRSAPEGDGARIADAVSLRL
jgi:hypothetical protein